MNKYFYYFIVFAFLSCYAFSNRCFAQTPVVSTFSPAKGFAGTVVTISGSGFNKVVNNNIVYFGAVRATVVSATATSLVVKAPIGATHQPVSVLNSDTHLTGYSSYPFHVTFPSNGSIMPNNFDARVSFGTGNTPSSITVSDLDGDGKSDIVITNTQSQSISIFRNTAVSGVINAASFASKIDIATGFLPSFADAGDIDGDGKPDVVVTNSASGSISIYKNVSTPGHIQFNSKINVTTAPLPSNIKIADLDGDGKPDLIVGHNTNGTLLSVYKNVTVPGSITSTSFGPETVMRTGFGYSYVNVADLDNDRKPEILLTNAATDRASYVYVYRNISTPGALSASSFESPVGYRAVANMLVVNVADMNDDGKPDMVLSNFGDRIFAEVSGDFYLTVLLNQTTSSGPFSPFSFKSGYDYETQRIPQSSAPGDLDGDGLMDAITANYGSNTLSIYHNESATSNFKLSQQINLPAGVSPQRVAIADMDGDGKADLLEVNDIDNTVSIYRNNASALQSINFGPLNGIVYGTQNFQVGAISNNPNNPLHYSSSNATVATVSSTGVVHTVGVGTTKITVTQNATDHLLPAVPVSQDLIVTPAPLIIKAEDKFKNYRTPNPVLTAAFSGLVNNDSQSDVVTSLTINTIADVNTLPGSYPITISGASISPNYSVSYIDGALTINKLMQTIVFDPIDNKFFNSPDFTISATASSGNPVSYSSSDNTVATITGNTVHIINIGKTIITAIQPGDEIYNAVSAINILTVLPVPVVITANTITPNDDGINDKWVIKGVDNNTTVSIFNRLGKIVYQNKGYTVPFNGVYNGKKLPAGVYYYIIAFTDQRANLSGSLTIFY